MKKNLTNKPEKEKQPKEKMFSYKGAKAEFHLTDSMMREIGEPDRFNANPYYSSMAKTKLYAESRLKAWVEQNQERVERVRLRREANPPTSLRATSIKIEEEVWAASEREWEGERRRAQSALARFLPLMAEFQVIRTPTLTELHQRMRDWRGQSKHVPIDVNPRDVCSHIRHRHTNYDRLLDRINRATNNNTLLYCLFKIWVSSCIVDTFSLDAKSIQATSGLNSVSGLHIALGLVGLEASEALEMDASTLKTALKLALGVSPQDQLDKS